jgi:hypothetical protein
MSKESTTVETLDMDLNAILNPGADSIMLPANPEQKKPSMFSRKTEDLSFLNEPIKPDPDPNADPDAVAKAAAAKVKADADAKAAAAAAAEQNPELTHQQVNDIVNEGDEDAVKNAQGRPKVDKQGLVEFVNKLIEKKALVPFEDEKPITEYTIKDYEELFEANFQERDRKIREAVPAEFFKSLPEELQYAAKYVSDGGRDLKGLFRTLASVEEVRTLDGSTVQGQKQIARSYLQATHQDWTPEEIEEELIGWEDKGELEAKSKKFQPKLEALTEKQVQYKIQQQERLREQQAEQAEFYMDNVYKTLEPADLNGLKLDKKTQNLLFTGLVQPSYQSVSGNQTNLLGHLLEKYQFVEPNHGLVAEALWLLADPEGYRTKVREVQKKAVVEDTVRKLKSEQAGKLASTGQDDDEDLVNRGGKKPAGIPRPSNNFFKR